MERTPFATSASQDLRPSVDLPLEILCRILCFLSPRDVVRLRSVSKLFQKVAYEPTIWRFLYTHTRFLRYPGPFPNQSAQFFERTLVRSERLARTWTTQPMRYASVAEISLGENFPCATITTSGRWLIACESSKMFVAYDIDSNGTSAKQALWEKSGPPIYWWNACTVMSDDGLVVYIMISDVPFDDLVSPWKLLEFRPSGNSDQLHHTLTIDVPDVRPRSLYGGMGLYGGDAPFCYISTQRLIFDSRSHMFYQFPEFSSQLINAPADFSDGHRPWVVLPMKTHVILTHFDSQESCTLIQAFALPVDPSPAHDGIGVLRLSHDVIVHGRILEKLTPIRNTVVDPTSGSVNIRLLHRFSIELDFFLECIDLTLPKQSPTGAVLPITVDRHLISEFRHDLSSPHEMLMPRIHLSHDGCVRGFMQFAKVNGEDWPYYSLSDCLALKFTVDGSGDRCVATLGRVEPLKGGPAEQLALFSNCDRFDGVTGKFCHIKNVSAETSGLPASYVIVVADIE